jgi:hypothetical protein
MGSVSGHSAADLAAFGSPVDALFDLCRKRALTTSEIEAVLNTGTVPLNLAREGSMSGRTSRLRGFTRRG